MKTVNRQARRTIALAGVLALSIPLAACGSDDEGGSTDAKPSGDAIKVMTLGPIDAQGFSIPGIKTAAEAAIKKVNDAGGVNGRPIELVVCNDDNDPNTAAGCARQAVQEGVVAVVGGLTTMEAQAVPGFEDAGIPMIGITPLNEFTSPVYYPFSSGGAGAYFGIAKAFVDDPECNKNVGVVMEDFEAAAGAAQLLELGVAASGGTYTGASKAAQGAADFGPAAAAAAEKSTCLAFVSGPQSAAQVALAIEATGTVKRSGSSDTLVQAVLGAGAEVSNLVTVTDFLPASSNEPGVTEYIEAAEAIDPDFESNQITASTWAAVELLAEVLDGVEEITPESVADAVSKVSGYDTGLGPVVDFTTPNPAKAFARLPLSSPMYTQVVENGELVLTDAAPFDIAAIYAAAAAAGQ